MTLNQIILGPIVLVAVFTWNYAWQGKIIEAPGKIYRDGLRTQIVGWKFWVPASAINFALVPLRLRV